MTGFDDYPELHDEVRQHVAVLSDQWAEPIATLAPIPWLHNELGDLAFRTPSSDLEERWESLLAIDAIQQTKSPFSTLTAGGRIYFVSITEAPHRVRFSVTEFLWASGFSVIEVSRPIVAVDGGIAELAVGIARRTPTRFVSQDEATTPQHT